MSNRSWSLMSAASVLALLPLAATQSNAPVSRAAHQFAPVTIGVHVVTATRPLDLASLTLADFGDNDALR